MVSWHVPLGAVGTVSILVSMSHFILEKALTGLALSLLNITENMQEVTGNNCMQFETFSYFFLGAEMTVLLYCGLLLVLKTWI